jgi:MerR family transcriptional regulator, light-induced transcriptional regulator
MSETRSRLRQVRRRLPVRELVDALVGSDESRARQIAVESLHAVRSRTDVFADLVQPAQYEIGELWYAGRIGVAVEHRATAIVEAVVEDLEPTPSARPVRPGTSCVLAAVGDEQHVVGLRVLQLALEDDGWSVEQLGGRTPVEELVAFVAQRRMALVGLSASYLPSLRALRHSVEQIKARRIPILVGGAAFNRVPGLWRRVGADGHGVDARVSVVLARRLVAR